MRPGERIRLADGSSDEIGRMYFIYTGDLICDAQFPTKTYRKVSIDLFVSVDEEERQRAEQIATERRREQELQRELARQQRLQELEDQRREKELELRKIRRRLEQSFIDADEYYRTNLWKRISLEDYLAEKSAFVRAWVNKATGTALDEQQAAAVGCVKGDVRVTARAGSGKTTTLLSRALFLSRHCGVGPDQLLLLAFNRKAADEMSTRLERLAGVAFPHVMTFHALAYAIVHPEENLLYDGGPGEVQGLSRSFQGLIDDYLQVPEFRADVQKLMLAHFREDWDRIIKGGFDRSREEFLRFRRSVQRESLRGEYVKSFGEKQIANFLFEHGVPYQYERNHWWSGINYRPDFTIPTGNGTGIIIEYFGLEGDPDYDELAEDKRRYWESKPHWRLVELYPRDIGADESRPMRDKIRDALLESQVECTRLTEDELWRQIRHRAIDRFTKACVGFVGRCRKRQLSAEALADLIKGFRCESDVEALFIRLASHLYMAYVELLANTGEEDFDGLLQRATKLVSAGHTRFDRKSGQGDLRRLKYVFIDEYQDFSELFFALIDALRHCNPDVEFFCVGDDWQAINGFAGGDLRFFHQFGDYFSEFTDLSIQKNYRSAQSIVSAGNAVMVGRGPPALAGTSAEGEVRIARLSAFQPTPLEYEQHPGDTVTPAALRIISKAIRDDRNVVLLSRRNALPMFVNYKASEEQRAATSGLDRFLDHVRAYFPKEVRNRIQVSSTHKFKGREADVVVVLDAVARSYPLIHPDWIFLRIFGDSIETITDEERRLFYVALTRAARTLIIFSDGGAESPFLPDLERICVVDKVDWTNYPAHVATAGTHVIVKVGNQPDRGTSPTFAIKSELKAVGFRWNSVGWPGWARTVATNSFSVEALRSELWAAIADGVEVLVFDERENELERYTIDRGNWKATM